MIILKKIIAIILCVALALFAFAACDKTESSTAKPDPNLSKPTGAYSNGTHHAEITIEDYGVIKLELYADIAPITVQNFCDLANDGFYDGLTFHRIISGFMMQGGGYREDGSEKDTASIKGEFSANGVKNDLAHMRGVISMARTNVMDSASSQFFIVHETSPHLDGQYAAFGMVTDGMDIVDEICAETPVTDSNGSVSLNNRPIIESIKIID